MFILQYRHVTSIPTLLLVNVMLLKERIASSNGQVMSSKTINFWNSIT